MNKAQKAKYKKQDTISKLKMSLFKPKRGLHRDYQHENLRSIALYQNGPNDYVWLVNRSPETRQPIICYDNFVVFIQDTKLGQSSFDRRWWYFHALMTVPKMPTNSTFTIKEATNKRYSCWLSRDAFVNLSSSRLRLRLQGDKLGRLLAIFQSSLHCGLIT